MIERNFSSAHQLRGYKGKCENLHGHNYRIEIYARGRELDNIGLLVDFVELKAAADEVVQYLDHRNINELDPFVELQPSAENLAKYILERVGAKVSDDRVQIYKVRCFETPTSVATMNCSRHNLAAKVFLLVPSALSYCLASFFTLRQRRPAVFVQIRARSSSGSLCSSKRSTLFGAFLMYGFSQNR